MVWFCQLFHNINIMHQSVLTPQKKVWNLPDVYLCCNLNTLQLLLIPAVGELFTALMQHCDLSLSSIFGHSYILLIHHTELYSKLLYDSFKLQSHFSFSILQRIINA